MEQTFVNLAKLEYEATRNYLPITLPRQYGFSSIAQVKEYIKQWGRDEGSREENPQKLMEIMMEVFFGHYSTCRLNHNELVAMWKKLMLGWSSQLYAQNEWIVPADKRATTRYYDFDEFVHKAEHRLEETTPTKKLKVALAHLHKRYRTKSELVLLVSMYSFAMGSRFYVVPLHLDPRVVQQYCALRDNMIEAWYEIAMDYPAAMRKLNPSRWLASIEPKSVAFKIFRPDLYVHTDMLNKKKTAFNTWWKRERKIQIESAQSTNDPEFIAMREREWDEAKLYATSLYNALLPRSKALDKEEDDFIDNTEYDDDENLHQELDNTRLDQEVRKVTSNLRHTNLIDEDAAEASGDYDKYVKRVLQRSDKRDSRKRRKFKNLEDSIEEGDEESEGEMEEEHGGDYIDQVEERL